MKIAKRKRKSDDPELLRAQLAGQKPLTYKMTIYLPKALAHKVKVKLAKEEKTLSEIFTKLADEYMKRPSV